MNLKLLRKAVSAMLALCLFAGGLAAQDKGFVLHEDFEAAYRRAGHRRRSKVTANGLKYQAVMDMTEAHISL